MKKGKFYILRWFKGYDLKVGLIDTINGIKVGYYREKNENGETVWTSIHLETGYTIERGKTKEECMLKTVDFIPKLIQYEQHISNGKKNMVEFLSTVAQ